MAKKTESTIQVETKKIMNRSSRAFHVNPDDVISGGELSADKKYTSINQGESIELVKEVADKLLKMFPVELLDLTAKGK